MFYEDLIKIETLDEGIQKTYEQVKSMMGELVIVDCTEIRRFVGLLRDDSFDGEWCYRTVGFPTDNRHCSDSSIIACRMTKLKGVIPDEDYQDMERIWELNLERNPYSSDYTKYVKEKVTNHPWSLHYRASHETEI